MRTKLDNYISANLTGIKKQLTGFGKIDFTHDFDKNKALEYSGKFNKTDRTDNSDLVFNNIPLIEKLTGNNQLFNHKITCTNRFKDIKVFLLTAMRIDEKTPQNYSVNQFLFSGLFSDSANNTRQFSGNSMQFIGMEAHLMNKKKNGDFTNNMSFADLLFTVNKKFNFQIQTKRYYFGNITQNSNTYYFMDLSAMYIAKPNKLTFSLSGNNLFNHKISTVLSQNKCYYINLFYKPFINY